MANPSSDKEPRTVYAVSSGEYSDYQVHFLCDSEAEAQAFIDNAREASNYGEYMSVESFSLYPEGSNPRQTPWYRVYLPLRGEMRVSEEWFQWNSPSDASAYIVESSYKHKGNIISQGPDRERAIRAAEELVPEARRRFLGQGFVPCPYVTGEVSDRFPRLCREDAIITDLPEQIEPDKPLMLTCPKGHKFRATGKDIVPCEA